MRRVILNLLLCPRCRRGSLHAESDVSELVFGPARCSACEARFPVSEGIVDLVGERTPRGLAQRLMETPWMARSYDRYLRQAFSRLTGHRMDAESRNVVQRSLLGTPESPILDLGCGTGALTRRLVLDGELPPVVGMDVSKPMLEEAIAQAREAAIRVDFLRAEAPLLPFRDGSLGAVILEGTLLLLSQLAPLLAEIRRVLVPGGRFVATTHLPSGRTGKLALSALGLQPHSEQTVRAHLMSAGFERIERVLVQPLLMIKAVNPPRQQSLLEAANVGSTTSH